jgi:3-methylfumaryl-CoA hydratase
MSDAELAAWVGRSQGAEGVARPEPLAALAALLDRDGAPRPGEALPPAWHWIYFLPTAPQRALGPDGHTEAGGLLPPLRGARRMWAGSRIAYSGTVTVGERLARRSTIAAVAAKEGRSGRFTLITVRHEIEGERGGRIAEEQDLVFRPPAAGGAEAAVAPTAPGPAAPAAFERRLVADPVLLFRFSAVTFNGHRIHYDHPYATRVEGYPGLVVHGPLMAILMLELLAAARPGAPLARFDFRAERPAFAGEPLRVAGDARADGVALRVEAAGRVASRLQAVLA